MGKSWRLLGAALFSLSGLLLFALAVITFPLRSTPAPIRQLPAPPPPVPAELPKEINSSGNAHGIPILMYHYVGANPDPKDRARDILSITPEKLDAQFSYLSQHGYNPISLDTIYGIFQKQAVKPTKPIVLTFDDGYIDFFLNAFPLLKKYNFHAVSFIPTGLIGSHPYMTWEQIREIHSTGLVSFQAHTVNHKDLTTLSYEQLIIELKTSKEELTNRLGYPINFIAYPFGAVNQTVAEAAAQVGFVGGVGTYPGRVTGASMVMPRVRVNGTISLDYFIATIR